MRRVGAAWTARRLVSASCPGLIINQTHSMEIKIHIDAWKYLLNIYYVPGNFLKVESTM